MKHYVDIVRQYHAGIKDKGSGNPYHWHLARVAIRLGDTSDEARMVALFHDVLEDTVITEADLAVYLPSTVLEGIKECSNIYYRHLTHKEWMAHIRDSQNPYSKYTKLADCADNMSFERMEGLESHLRATNISRVRKPDVIMSSVRATIKKKSYGLASRFLEDIEILLSKGDDWAQNINVQSFGSWAEYKSLQEYIPGEFLDYARGQKVGAVRVSCPVGIIKDRGGQPYLAAIVPSDVAGVYQSAALNFTNLDALGNQEKRDGAKHHITILTSAEFAALGDKSLVEAFTNSPKDFVFSSIGSIKKDDNSTHYALCESGYAQKLRDDLGLPAKDLHMTLGFTKKDLFHLSKNRTTAVGDFSTIWSAMDSSFKSSLNLKI